MSDPTQKTPEAWTRNLLFGSIALNVFLAGFLFAKIIDPTQSPELEPVNFTFSSMPSDISNPLSERLENKFRPHQEELRRAYEDLRTVRFRVQDILSEEDFDEVAMEKALANVRKIQLEIQMPMHAALIEAAKELDYETRRNLNILNNTFEGPGTWELKRVDGERWRVEFDNGEFVMDLQGITDAHDEEDNE